MPAFLHIVLASSRRSLGGAVWAAIAGLLKALDGRQRGDHDDHAQLDRDLGRRVAVQPRRAAAEHDPAQKDVPVSNDVVAGAKLPVFWGDPELQGLHIGLFIALAALLVFWVMLNRTTLGYEVRAVGFNPDAARAAGISVGRNYIIVMAVCGAFAGLAGALDVLGWQFRIATNDIQTSQLGLLRDRGRAARAQHRGRDVLFSALLFGGADHRHVGAQPGPDGVRARAGHEPHYMIQGLVVLLVSTDVLVVYLWKLRRRRREAPPPTRSAA